MKRLLSTWPLWLLLLDLVYAFGRNLAAGASLQQSALPDRGLPVAPEIAFNGLQVLANGGMLLLLGWSFWVLMRLNRAVLDHSPWPLTPLRILALLLVLSFSLPAWWHWFWAIWDLMHGQLTVAWQNPRYLAVALLMPYPAWLCLRRLSQRRRHTAVPPPPPDQADTHNNQAA